MVDVAGETVKTGLVKKRVPFRYHKNRNPGPVAVTLKVEARPRRSVTEAG
jgi:hypothetical protein